MRTVIAVALATFTAASLEAQGPTLSETVLEYVSVNAPVVALTNATVIDGTGAPARTGQTVLIENGRIAAVGGRRDVRVPRNAEVLDLRGHTGDAGPPRSPVLHGRRRPRGSAHVQCPSSLPGGGRNDGAYDGKPGALRGAQPEARDRPRTDARTANSHHGPLYHGW